LFQAQGQNIQKFYDAYSHTPGYVGLCFANKSYANFAYQVHMTVQQGDGGGLIFRATTPNFNSAMYRFDVRPSLQVFNILIQTDNAKRTNPVCDSQGDTYCLSPLINKTGENTLTVIAEGNILYFYINGICVAGVKDNTISAGYIGVYAVDQKNKTDVAFDSAEVWQIS